MGTIASLLMVLVSINPSPVENDLPTIYIDGCFEISHVWDDSTEAFKFDQFLIWKYDDEKDYFKIMHWEIIKDGRTIDRIYPKRYYNDLEEITWFIPYSEIKDEILYKLATLLANYDREKLKKELIEKKEKARKEFAKMQKCDTNDIMVYLTHDWIGPRYYCRADYNHNLKMYETVLSLNGRDVRFRAKHFYETHTRYDPEIEYRTKYHLQPGDVKMTFPPSNKK